MISYLSSNFNKSILNTACNSDAAKLRTVRCNFHDDLLALSDDSKILKRCDLAATVLVCTPDISLHRECLRIFGIREKCNIFHVYHWKRTFYTLPEHCSFNRYVCTAAMCIVLSKYLPWSVSLLCLVRIFTFFFLF